MKPTSVVVFPGQSTATRSNYEAEVDQWVDLASAASGWTLRFPNWHRPLSAPAKQQLFNP